LSSDALASLLQSDAEASEDPDDDLPVLVLEPSMQVTDTDGTDQINGYANDDDIRGGAGDDTLTGGVGDDSLVGDAGDDALHGNDDDDVLDGGVGQDALFGGSGNDLLIGTEEGAAEQDVLNAGAGDDTLVVGGDDIATGLDGQDTFILGDWIADGSVAVLQDFDVNEDALVVVYDDALYDDMPAVTMTNDESGGGVTHIHLNGTQIASLQGVSGLTSDGFLVISNTDAIASGLLQAA
jgi:Ca2+-binding RTX toxin-like protein